MLDNYAGLTDAELSELEKHAAECEACRGELGFFKSIMNTASVIPVPEPPLDLIDKVNSRIDRIPAATRRLDSLKNNARAHIRPIMTVAACLAVGIVVGLNQQAIRDRLTDNSTDGVISTTVSVTDSGGKDIGEYEINEVPVVEDAQPAVIPEPVQPAAKPVVTKAPAATAVPARATAKPSFKPSAEQRVTLPVITQAPAAPSVPAAPSAPAVPVPAPATITATAATAEPVIATAAPKQEAIVNSRYRIARGNYHIPETAMATAAPTAEPKSAEIVKEDYQIAMGSYDVVTEEEKEELLQNKLIVSEADIKTIVDCMNRSKVRGTTTGYVASSSAFANFLAMLDAQNIYYNFIRNKSGTGEITFVLLAN